MSFPSQCFKHYSLLCLRHLFDPKWFYWKYRNSFELICHTCSALPPLGENVYLYLCICVLICCICVSVFVVFVVVYVFAFGHLSHMFRTASTQYTHLCNCFVYFCLSIYTLVSLYLLICHTCSHSPHSGCKYANLQISHQIVKRSAAELSLFSLNFPPLWQSNIQTDLNLVSQ